MPKYVIERDWPGVGPLSPEELHAMSSKSLGILRELGPDIQWVQSYVTGDKIYCVYIASSPELIEEHALCAGIPVTRISEVQAIIDPATGEA